MIQKFKNNDILFFLSTLFSNYTYFIFLFLKISWYFLFTKLITYYTKIIYYSQVSTFMWFIYYSQTTWVRLRNWTLPYKLVKKTSPRITLLNYQLIAFSGMQWNFFYYHQIYFLQANQHKKWWYTYSNFLKHYKYYGSTKYSIVTRFFLKSWKNYAINLLQTTFLPYNYLKYSDWSKFCLSFHTNEIVKNFPQLYQRNFLTHRLVTRKYRLYFYYQHITRLKIRNQYSLVTSQRVHQLTTNKNFTKNSNFLIDFFKFEKLYKFKTFFFDMKRRVISKLRDARQVHFKFSVKTTLNKRTYVPFLKKELHKNVLLTQEYTLSWVVFLMKICYTWAHLDFLITMQLIRVNGELPMRYLVVNVGDIIQWSPLLHSLSVYKSYAERRKRINYLFNKYKYLYWIQKKKRWMKRKKNPSKYLKWLGFIHGVWSKNFFFDPLTGTFSLIHKQLKNYNEYHWYSRYSTVLKLYQWRFRP